MNKTRHVSVDATNKPAIIAGSSLLGMAILAPIAHFGILPRLVSSDALATADNVTANPTLFFSAVICLFLVAILDVLVAVSLYKFFAAAKSKLTFYMALARILYAGIFLIAISFLMSALILEAGTTHIAERIAMFTTIWDAALLLFGVHLIVLALLFWRTSYAPTWIAPLLIIAGLGYGIDSIGTLLIENYTIKLASVAFIGEVVLIFWLLIRGRNI